MPLYDRRTMEGVYSVEQTAQIIRHYRYAEVKEPRRKRRGFNTLQTTSTADHQLSPSDDVGCIGG